VKQKFAGVVLDDGTKVGGEELWLQKKSIITAG
jgi:hypothetical protein